MSCRNLIAAIAPAAALLLALTRAQAFDDLMPTKKDQPPPDTRYFNQSRK